MYNSQSVRF